MKYVLATLVSLVVADGIISRFIVRNGLGREANPVLQALVGENNFLLIKLAAALICALILWDLFKTRPKLALSSSLVFIVLYTAILFWNIGMYLTSLV